jgi:hypothetical protein
MLSSVAEFYEDDVQNRMTAVLALIEPSIMIFMGIFVAFVLVALYLPIFSLVPRRPTAAASACRVTPNRKRTSLCCYTSFNSPCPASLLLASVPSSRNPHPT